AALRAAGALVAAIVVIGRAVDVDGAPGLRRWWAAYVGDAEGRGVGGCGRPSCPASTRCDG
ncbi:MAG: hypothetical protein ACYDD6_13095, partial [Acidimicrobiales bacterium]